MLLMLVFASVFQTMASNSASKTFLSNIPKNCKEIQDQGGNITGIYTIKPDAAEEPFFVYCDMDTRGGGWLYLLNRIDGSQVFTVPWNDYKNGFGNLAREFWLGLEHLFQLTGKEINELLVELIDWNLKKYHMHYKGFSVASEEQYYRLQIIGGYTGDLEDALIKHGGSNFSTIDRDNDNYIHSCGKEFEGGWWFKACHYAYLTGIYHSGVKDYSKGICWYTYRKINPNFQYYVFKEARMMIRPQSDPSPKI